MSWKLSTKPFSRRFGWHFHFWRWRNFDHFASRNEKKWGSQGDLPLPSFFWSTKSPNLQRFLINIIFSWWCEDEEISTISHHIMRKNGRAKVTFPPSFFLGPQNLLTSQVFDQYHFFMTMRRWRNFDHFASYNEKKMRKPRWPSSSTFFFFSKSSSIKLECLQMNDERWLHHHDKKI